MKKPRHVPIRTCVACRATDEKRDLLRVVRQPDGSVLYDPKGKLSGRGAYICASASCIALARKQKRLERSLKVSSVPEELFNALSAQTASLQAGSGPAAVAAGVAPETRGEGGGSAAGE
jgi:predicted RNA-binding protein YlxR (DUF448 family)